MAYRVASAALALCLAALIVGCADRGKEKELSASEQKEKKIAEARAKLDAADRALVDAQDYCPVMPEKRLGEMGVPVKIELKGQPVFLCCKGCKRTAESDPDGTLKVVKDLKANYK